MRHFWWWWFMEQGKRGKQGTKFARMSDDQIIDFVTDLPYTCEIDLINSDTQYPNAGCTLYTIGKATGLTRERIRQIEATALKKMNFFWRLEYIKDFRRQSYGVQCDPLLTMYPDSF
jgi:hypothetical protein